MIGKQKLRIICAKSYRGLYCFKPLRKLTIYKLKILPDFAYSVVTGANISEMNRGKDWLP